MQPPLPPTPRPPPLSRPPPRPPRPQPPPPRCPSLLKPLHERVLWQRAGPPRQCSAKYCSPPARWVTAPVRLGPCRGIRCPWCCVRRRGGSRQGSRDPSPRAAPRRSGSCCPEPIGLHPGRPPPWVARRRGPRAAPPKRSVASAAAASDFLLLSPDVCTASCGSPPAPCEELLATAFLAPPARPRTHGRRLWTTVGQCPCKAGIHCCQSCGSGL
mmetsp:Transcript_130524/g.363708  ORF Transcript_130524/g.363708 Transcript_130524/m.363708 type:complete len:214 (+) Transcript_130524:1324-1965(+)